MQTTTIAQPVTPAQTSLPTLQPTPQPTPVETGIVVNSTIEPPKTSCSFNFNIEQRVVLDMQLPWGLFANDLSYAFISKEAKLIVADTMPMFNETTQDFILPEDANYIWVGNVAPEFLVHYKDSLAFRPEVEAEELQTYDETQVEVKEEVKEDKPDVITSPSVNWHNVSNSAKRREVKKLKSQGKQKHEVDTELQRFW